MVFSSSRTLQATLSQRNLKPTYVSLSQAYQPDCFMKNMIKVEKYDITVKI